MPARGSLTGVSGGTGELPMSDETRTAAADRNDHPRPAAISLATAESFALQGARSATIYESTGRATMFLGAVSGGLVALGLVATATRVSTAFYAFGLVLLPTLAFVGWVTFERVLKTGIEDHDYARRMEYQLSAWLRYEVESEDASEVATE
jgi:hypothetical protein